MLKVATRNRLCDFTQPVDVCGSLNWNNGTRISFIDILLNSVALQGIHKRLQFRAVFVSLANSDHIGVGGCRNRTALFHGQSVADF